MKGAALGGAALAGLAAYLGLMLGVGYAARRSRKEASLADFYLAGGRLGPFVLFFTLYASQYSGNSLIGYPGEAFRMGFSWIMCVGFMMAIVVSYLLFVPQLHRQAKRHFFVTPGDWLDHRFGCPGLTLAANVVLVVSVANYLLAQLMAMGHVASGVSGGAVPYWLGVVLFTAVIALYESMGGMRAVAWTDCVQGMMLLVGLGGILVAVGTSPARLSATTEWILAHQPEKALVPSWTVSVTWMSTIILIGLSGAVYPHAIQRVYAARDTATLKRSLTLMVFMPLVTMTPIVLVGIWGIVHFDGLGRIEADQLMPLFLTEWASGSALLHALSVLVFVGTVAAIMSTADSVLLSLSSILTKDVLGKTWLRGATDEALTRAGKQLSWLIVAVLVGVALVPRVTLWGLTELKMEILVQVAPLFILGIHWRRLAAAAALSGLVAGTLVASGLTLAGLAKVGGLHAGLIGLLANLSLCWALSLPQIGRARQALSSQA